MNYDIEIAWQINNFCNFDCVYCWLHGKNWAKGERFIGINDTQKIINGFNRTGLKLLIHMSGGEPFFFPNFVNLCQELTKKHFISINTNLTHKDTFRFTEIINPEKVNFLHCSLHIQERGKTNKIKDFIKKYKLLQNQGFHVFASYLMYPHLIKQFKKDYVRFKSEGILLKPKVFWGNCARFKIIDLAIFRKMRHFFGKHYPESYSAKQKNLIKSYINTSNYDENINVKIKKYPIKRTIDLALDKNWLNKLPSFKGKNCLAGKKFVKMDQDGQVYRCNDEHHHYLGNLFSDKVKLFNKILKCSVDTCSCPYVGYRYATQQ